jgi:hypothetical protein
MMVLALKFVSLVGSTMKTHWNRFNIYLLAALATVSVCGCKSAAKHKKQLSAFRLHLEVNADASNRSQDVPIYRAQPFMLTIDKSAFLTEANVAEAKVIDVVGGFAISTRFDRQGKWLLDSFSTANRGRHFAIFAQWTAKPGDKLGPGRWLAAPEITKTLSEGMLIFTPDATREESDEIVLGLNNVAKKLKTASEMNW